MEIIGPVVLLVLFFGFIFRTSLVHSAYVVRPLPVAVLRAAIACLIWPITLIYWLIRLPQYAQLRALTPPELVKNPWTAWKR